jgi:hypothetical protein
MKKYLVLSFAFLLMSVPVLAKGSNENQGQQNSSNSKPIVSISPTGKQEKNENNVQTKNEGDEKELKIETQENEQDQLNQVVDESLNKVSDQVKQLIETTGAKGGIGIQVKEIAQNQTKLQDEIKLNLGELNSRNAFTKLMLGSDKELVKSMEQKMDQNKLMIQQLEELKLQTKNTSDLEELQQTIDLIIYQNTALEDKVTKENKTNGLFGWFINFFNK